MSITYPQGLGFLQGGMRVLRQHLPHFSLSLLIHLLRHPCSVLAQSYFLRHTMGKLIAAVTAGRQYGFMSSNLSVFQGVGIRLQGRKNEYYHRNISE